MKVWMLWHGGASYAVGSIPEDVEAFDSIESARWAFAARTSDPYYPCVSEEPPEDGGPSAWVFFSEPEGCDPYPDEVWNFGPRGGVQRCPA